MALSLLSAVSDWWTGHIGAPAVQSNIVDPTNAAIAALNQIQHGTDSATVTSGNADGPISTTFPRAFSSAPNVVATNTSSANRDYGVQIQSVTTTGFTGRVHHWDGTNAGATVTVNFDWIAIAT